MQDLKLADIIEWFRAKSREYADTADRLERDYFMNASAPFATPNAPIPAAPATPLIESIAAYLKVIGSKRPADIAEHVKAKREDVVAAIAANADRFEVASKGWIKLKEEPKK